MSENENSENVANVANVVNPRQRLRELLAIRDSDRTDEEWDELHEIEIQLAVCNHINNTATPERKQHKNKPAQAQRQNKPANNHGEAKKQHTSQNNGTAGKPNGGKSRGPRRRMGNKGAPRNAEGSPSETVAATIPSTPPATSSE